MRIVKTHTGKIYVDKDKKLEFLTVGDYGKENNIKASFLGLNKEINGVQHHTVDLADKWVATISTQKGCPMNCQFCDCPKYGFHGNVSREELVYEIETILANERVHILIVSMFTLLVWVNLHSTMPFFRLLNLI